MKNGKIQERRAQGLVFDVVIIGGGVVGCAIAYELSRYDVKTALIEAENDIATGTTKANSGIVHAGYDPKPGTLMAKLNVVGANAMEQYCDNLNVPYKKCGSLVLAFEQEEMKEVQKLYERGKENGVHGLEIWNGERVAREEPNLAKVEGALYCANAGVVSPWELALGLAEFSAKNGVEFSLSNPVISIKKDGEIYTVTTEKQSFKTKNIVNAAGLNCEKIHNMVLPQRYKTSAHKGQYFLLDNSQNDIVKHVIFQCPNKLGKGVLVSPTAHGNIIVGPDSQEVDGNDSSVTRDGLSFVSIAAKKSVPSLDLSTSIRNFAGVRSIIDQEDFLVEKTADGFFEAAGIKSPGLVSAIGIGKYMLDLLEKNGLMLCEKEIVEHSRKYVDFKHMSAKQRKNLVEQDPSYGRIICRCESVTEGEVIDALKSPIKPVSVDGIKRRCAAGSGRCQGGFCSPRVMELISKHNDVSLDDIPQDKSGSFITTGNTKGGSRDV